MLFLLFFITSLSLCADLQLVIDEEETELITLDISRDGLSTEYIFAVDGNIKSFTCNPGFRINKVIDTDSEIWEGDDLGKKIEVHVSNRKEYRVAILHDSGNFSLFCRYRPFLKWVNITRDQLDMEKVAMNTDSSTKINNYTKELTGMAYGYVLPRRPPCYQVRFNDRILWDYFVKFRMGYITSVWIDLLKGGMFIRVMFRSAKHQIGPEDGLRLYGESVELGTNGYRRIKDGERMNYMLRHTCRSIKYYGDTIWEHTGGPDPNVIVFYRNHEIIEIRFNREKIECKMVDGIWFQERRRYEHITITSTQNTIS